MRRKQWLRAGRAAALLAVAAFALTGCSTAEWEDKLRFGFPRGVTDQASHTQALWTWTGVTALALGVVVWALIFWACIRYRKKNDELPRQTKYNFVVEMICFTFPFVIIAGLFYRTVIVEDDINKLSANPDAVVQVNAFKWGWQFEYVGYRGQPGQELPNVYQGKAITAYTSDDTASGTVLTNPNDTQKTGQYKNGKPFYLRTTGSQYEIPVLVIPLGQKVQFIEHSEDVLHSFWVPDFLFKRDVVPFGTTDTTEDNRFEITATQVGSYVGRCAELCGVYHSQMNFEVRVVQPADFQKYLDTLRSLGKDNADPQPAALNALDGRPYATTTHPFLTDRSIRHASTDQSTEGGN